MDTHQKYEALIRIQNQLNDYAAYFPEWKFRMHGNKDLNEALQDLKKIISLEAMNLLTEESEKMQLYFEGSPNSLGIDNIE